MRHAGRLLLVIVGAQFVAIPLSFVILIAILPVLRSLEKSTGIEMIGHSGPADWVIAGVWVVISLFIVATLIATRPRKEGSTHED
jgi:hypothetical protein